MAGVPPLADGIKCYAEVRYLAPKQSALLSVRLLYMIAC
jgi:hypothetical protein